MSEITPSIDDEDKAQSTLGSQSALLSMLNMGMIVLLPIGMTVDKVADIACSF